MIELDEVEENTNEVVEETLIELVDDSSSPDFILDYITGAKETATSEVK